MPTRRSSDEGGYAPMSEINVTPLVDVMLVLLTIFMVTAPFLLQSVNVKLPKTAPVAMMKPDPALVVTVQIDGKTTLGKEAVDLPTLESRLKAAFDKNAEVGVQLRADTGVPYGLITEVMAAASRAGVAKLTFITAHAPEARP